MVKKRSLSRLARNSFLSLAVLYSVSILILIGCARPEEGVGTSIDKDSGDIIDSTKPIPKNQLVTGSIGGRDWKFLSGRARSMLVGDRNYVKIELWSRRVTNPCASVDTLPANLGPIWVEMITPANLEEHFDLSEQLQGATKASLKLIDLKNKEWSKFTQKVHHGEILLSNFYEDSLRGYVTGSHNKENIIKGWFEVPFCP